MSKEIKSLSIFCDESHPVKHDGEDFFIIGCCYTNSDKVERFAKEINSFKEKYGYHSDYELKFSNLHGKNLPLFKEIVKYIKHNDSIFVRVWIVPNKQEKQYKFMLDHEKLYNRMYRLLLKKIFIFDFFKNIEQAFIFFDKRNSKSEDNAKNIADYLELNSNAHISTNIVDSKEHIFVQLADLFVGATAYERTGRTTSPNKLELIEYIKETFGLRRLNFRTSIKSVKYSSFIWDGRYGI